MLPIIHTKLRKDKISKGKCPVVLQVYYQKDRKQIFTGLSIEPEFWDDEKQEANKWHHDQAFFNRTLKNKYEATEKEYFKQSALSENIDIHAQQKRSRQNFYDYAVAYYDGLKNRAGEHYIKKCKTAIRDFKAHAGNVNFQGVTPQVLKQFEDHLFSLGRSRNTINFIFKKIKQPFIQANKEKITDHNPFNIFHPITYKQTKREFLTMDEILILESKDFGKLNYIRDYFCICCRTGLRFGDMKRFDKNEFIISNKGTERIIISTEKTGAIVSIKMQPSVKKLIDRIDKPLPSNVHSNRLLKIIGEVAGIEKPLHWHLSRHAFATNCASLGIPIEVVAKLVGHSNLRTTAIYFKLVDSKIDEYMDKWE